MEPAIAPAFPAWETATETGTFDVDHATQACPDPAVSILELTGSNQATEIVAPVSRPTFSNVARNSWLLSRPAAGDVSAVPSQPCTWAAAGAWEVGESLGLVAWLEGETELSGVAVGDFAFVPAESPGRCDVREGLGEALT